MSVSHFQKIILGSSIILICSMRGLASPAGDVELPPFILNTPVLIGASIIDISAHDHSFLGLLKLTTSPLIRGRIVPQSTAGQDVIVVEGCVVDCFRPHTPKEFFKLPAKRATSGTFVVSFAALAEQLTFSKINADRTHDIDAQSIGSTTNFISFVDGTLTIETSETLFDRVHKESFIIKTRWFAKVLSAVSQSFVPQTSNPKLGFFTSKDASTGTEYIHKLPLQSATTSIGALHFYIKGVPLEWQNDFKEAFDRWNDVFMAQSAQKAFDYTFVEDNDALSQTIQIGDMRFNVIEWDRVQIAPYAGLTSSFSDPLTGQILSAHVLIQGPKILADMKHWYEGSPSNLPVAPIGPINSDRFSLDPIGSALEDLDDPPAGVSFKTYMHGYFVDLVEHELGHVLGLRHNFAGSLGATAALPSSSVMEYLSRGERFKKRIGPYDLAAIKFGYYGLTPDAYLPYCTDEQLLSPFVGLSSPECMNSDSGRDPYHYSLAQIDTIMKRLEGASDSETPHFTMNDVLIPFEAAFNQISGYAARASTQAQSWISWKPSPDWPQPPTEPEVMNAMVLQDLHTRFCADSFVTSAKRKTTAAAKLQTQKNIEALLDRGQTILDAFKLPPVLDCN